MAKGILLMLGVVVGMVFCVQGLETDLFEDTANMIEDCQDRPITICIKERALKAMDRFPSEYDFGGGLAIRPAIGVKRSARYFNPNSLPKEPNAREELLDEVLMDRIVDYLSSHTFQFKVPEDTIRELKRSLDNVEKPLDEEDDDVRNIEEGRKKKKKMMPLLLLLKMKAAAIGAIMLKMIGLLAFKALVIAKIALLLSSIIALKKLVDHKHHSPSYEVIAAHPYEDHGHSFDRSFDNPDLPYRAYAPENIK